jgi:hypothetical protein
MVDGKRLGITTVLGVIAGFLSLWWMRVSAGTMPVSEEAMIVLSWTVLGFAIGLSAWKANWAAHGIVMGIIFSLPQDFAFAWNGAGVMGFWRWLVAGLVVGFLIELITTPILHAGHQMYQTPQTHAGG